MEIKDRLNAFQMGCTHILSSVLFHRGSWGRRAKGSYINWFFFFLLPTQIIFTGILNKRYLVFSLFCSSSMCLVQRTYLVFTFSPIITWLTQFFFYFLLSNLVNLGLYLFLVLFNTQSSIFFCLGLIDSGIFWLRATESNHRLRHCTDCTSLEPASRLFLAKYYQV